MQLGSFHEVQRLCPPLVALLLVLVMPNNVNGQTGAHKVELQKGMHKNVTSPMYPSHYPNNEHVIWNISAPTGYRILAKLGMLHLERYKDYLRFEDAFGRDLISLTGQSSPPAILSPTNVMLMVFTSDDSSSDAGFRFELSPFNQSDAEVRLADGTALYNGRVEVYSETYGWSTVSDAGWDLKDAATFCKEVGFPGAVKPVSDAYFGAGVGRVLYSNVDCSNDNFRLQDCLHDNRCSSDCSHNHDAGVICHKPNYLGCFYLVINDGSPLKTAHTVDECINKCSGPDTMYAAINDQTCYCGSSLDLSDSTIQDDTVCHRECRDDANQLCGAIDTNIFSVYNTKLAACKDPGIPGNGTRTGDYFTFGSEVTFNCSEGFKLIGDWRIRCIPGESILQAKWNHNTPICMPVVENSTIPTTNATSTALPQQSEDMMIIIIAAVVSGVAFLLLVVLLICCIYKCKGCRCWCRRKRTRLEMWY